VARVVEECGIGLRQRSREGIEFPQCLLLRDVNRKRHLEPELFEGRGNRRRIFHRIGEGWRVSIGSVAHYQGNALLDREGRG
jgi:hypothetical protein